MFKLSSIDVVFQHEQQIHRPFWGEHNRHNKIHSRKSFFGKQTLILLFYQILIVTWSNFFCDNIREKTCENFMSCLYFLKNAQFNLHIGDNF